MLQLEWLADFLQQQLPFWCFLPMTCLNRCSSTGGCGWGHWCWEEDYRKSTAVPSLLSLCSYRRMDTELQAGSVSPLHTMAVHVFPQQNFSVTEVSTHSACHTPCRGLSVQPSPYTHPPLQLWHRQGLVLICQVHLWMRVARCCHCYRAWHLLQRKYSPL